MTFVDASSGGPTSWSWAFGDGSSGATGASVSHTYTVGGTFTAVVTVSDSVEGATTAGVAVGMAIALVTVVLTIGGPLEPYLGLLERAYVAVPSLWLVGIAFHGLVVTTGRFGA